MFQRRNTIFIGILGLVASFLVAQGVLGGIVVQKDFDMTGMRIVNVADPTADNHAANVRYVKSAISTGGDNLGSHSATQALDMNAFNIVDTNQITEVNKIKFDNQIGDKQLELYTNYGLGIQGSTLDYHSGRYHAWYGTQAGQSNGAGSNMLLDTSGSHLYVYGSVRSPLFYDQDNTGYYVDPAGTSRLNTISGDRYYDAKIDTGGSYLTAKNWLEFTSNLGLYWSNNAWHIYPYDNHQMRFRSGASDWGAIRANTAGTDRNYIYWDSSNNIGFLTTAGSWALRVDNSKNAQVYNNLTVDGGISTYDASVADNTIETGQLCLGNGTNCRTTWPTGGDNLGNHTATQNLNMSGYQIQNMRIENRTSDPASPIPVGQIWLRTDL